jgi:hypothetical protein
MEFFLWTLGENLTHISRVVDTICDPDWMHADNRACSLIANNLRAYEVPDYKIYVTVQEIYGLINNVLSGCRG